VTAGDRRAWLFVAALDLHLQIAVGIGLAVSRLQHMHARSFRRQELGKQVRVRTLNSEASLPSRSAGSARPAPTCDKRSEEGSAGSPRTAADCRLSVVAESRASACACREEHVSDTKQARPTHHGRRAVHSGGPERLTSKPNERLFDTHRHYLGWVHSLSLRWWPLHAVGIIALRDKSLGEVQLEKSMQASRPARRRSQRPDRRSVAPDAEQNGEGVSVDISTRSKPTSLRAACSRMRASAPVRLAVRSPRGPGLGITSSASAASRCSLRSRRSVARLASRRALLARSDSSCSLARRRTSASRAESSRKSLRHCNNSRC
jgi:hypothetical protein